MPYSQCPLPVDGIETTSKRPVLVALLGRGLESCCEERGLPALGSCLIFRVYVNFPEGKRLVL